MKVQLPLLQALTLSTLSHATKIYVSLYSGNITTVSVTPKADGSGNLTLAAISSTVGCLPNPSWLELDKNKSTLYCADEGISTAKANFTSFSISGNGTLQRRDEIVTLNGGVYSTIYGNGSVLALANYGGSGISIIDIKDPTHLEILQDAIFSFNPPRMNPTTNTSVVPYIHQTIIDPTQAFLLAPDLSGDLIHVFSLSSSYILERLPAQTDISVPKGHGPRHGVFYQPVNGSSATYLYVVMETANMVHGYQVKYNADKTLNFTMIQALELLVPASAAAAEIRLTPDNKYLIVSSRSDNNFTIPNPDPKNSTQIPSDSLFTFLISPSNGTISLIQRFPAGGLLPRQFEINKAGNMLAVALNGDNRLIILGRDVAGGNMTRILASLDIDVGGKGPGMVTCAVWDEDDENQASKGNSSVVTSASSARSSKALVLPTSTNKPAVSTGGGLSDEELISVLSAGLAAATSKNPHAAGPTLSAIEIMESMISLAASATALEGIVASLTRSNPSATSVAAGALESMIALSSSMAVLSDDLESLYTMNPASTTQSGGSIQATGVVPSTTPPTALASTTSGSAASAAGAVTTPTPFQAGMVGNCTKFHLVVSGDTCSSIATAAGVSLSDFYTWNPAVGTSCATLFAKNNVCIGVGSSH